MANSKRSLYAIYGSLLSEFGPQGWWPTISFQSPYLCGDNWQNPHHCSDDWRSSAELHHPSGFRHPVSGSQPAVSGPRITYHPGDYSHPRTEEERFQIVAGALLTQNTNWKNAEKALLNLHSARKLSPEKILSLPLSELESLIRPAGYFRQKARRLKALSEAYLKAEEDAETEVLRKYFLSINGVGPETADSILLYAYGRPVFVIDAYTRRMCASLKLFSGKDYEEYRSFFQSGLPPEPELFNEFHALIVEWGKRNPSKPI